MEQIQVLTVLNGGTALTFPTGKDTLGFDRDKLEISVNIILTKLAKV